MSVEFDTPANRIIQQLQPKNQFRIDTSLPDIAFLRQLSVQGRLFFQQAQLTGTTQTDITPTNGSTFFFYRLVFVQRSGISNSDIQIVNDGQVRLSQRSTAGTHAQVEISFVDSLVGDGIKTFSITHTNSGAINVSIFGWTENTSRIRDPV